MSEANYKKIWHTVALIPLGSVSTYGRIADLSGLPRRARLVSKALKQAPLAKKLPWHRVIGADGRISIPRHDPAYKKQIESLRQEGVLLINNRIDLARYLWQPSIEEMIHFLKG